MARTRSAYNRPQIGLKLSKEADEKLAVLAANGNQKTCPTCGSDLKTHDVVVVEPVSKSTKAGELLELLFTKSLTVCNMAACQKLNRQLKQPMLMVFYLMSTMNWRDND